MSDHPLDRLPPRDKPPATVRAIETWIQRAEREAGIGARRLGWMVASVIVIAALQRAAHHDGEPRFLVKGGTYLELRLGIKARATRDIDTMFRGSFDDFLDVLDETLAEPFGGITFQRSESRPIAIPGRIVKPRRLDLSLRLRGRTWRKIPLEVSPDEGRAGARVDRFAAPSLTHFGMDSQLTAAGIVMDYQLAQKLHACTDPHTPEHPNDRVRDIVDLYLIRSAFYGKRDNLVSLAEACRDLFAARAREAEQAGDVTSRSWPPEVIAHPHWETDYRTLASEVNLEVSLEEAVGMINGWIERISR